MDTQRENLNTDHHIATTDAEDYCLERMRSNNKLLKAYPHKFNISIQFGDYIKMYEKLNEGEKIISKENLHSIMGRVIFKREAGRKLIFYTLFSNGLNLQVMSDQRIYHDASEFKDIHNITKRGDIVGIEGYPARTRKGELSIIPVRMQIFRILVSVDIC